jgi:hypothetical protein
VPRMCRALHTPDLAVGLELLGKSFTTLSLSVGVQTRYVVSRHADAVLPPLHFFFFFRLCFPLLFAFKVEKWLVFP